MNRDKIMGWLMMLLLVEGVLLLAMLLVFSVYRLATTF